MITEVKIISGLVEVNPYGDWDDVDRGIYIDHDKVDGLFRDYEGQTIKVTIEIKESK